MPTFFSDLRFSLAAWRRFPWLPPISIALALATLLNGSLTAVAIVALIIGAGWLGTERIVYLRAFRSKPIRPSELWRFTRSFVVRFAVLGVCVGLPLMLLPLVLFATGRATGARSWGVLVFVLYAYTAVVDVALTFVTPALAYTTRRVGNALRIGLGMIRSEWPTSAWYVLAPPLAALVLARSLPEVTSIGVGGALILSASATLLNLWFKGAIAACYLRRHQVDDDGAAFLPREISVPGHKKTQSTH